MKNYQRYILLIIFVLTGCPHSKQESQQEYVDTFVQDASETEFGDPEYGLVDTLAAAEGAGVDYKQVLAGCMAKDAQSMHKMFWLSKRAGFDAASAQGHAAVLGMLVRKLGDAYFGECLSKETKEIQASVRDDLSYDLGEGEFRTSEEIAEMYPKTFP